MTISSEEASQIRGEQAFLKESINNLVSAIHDNTQRVGEMLVEMKERDVRDEYREKEFQELKDSIKKVDDNINAFIKEKEPVIKWAEKRKEVYESIWSGITSTWGKFAGALLIVAVAAALGLDITKVFGK